MQTEALPQTLLKNKSYDVQNMVSALQGLNNKVAALATQATAAAKPARSGVGCLKRCARHRTRPSAGISQVTDRTAVRNS